MMAHDGLRIDLHTSCHAGHQAHAVRYPIDVDAHWHALRKSHPGEQRINRAGSCLVRLSVWNDKATSTAVDVATDELAVTHGFDRCRVGGRDPAETGLLEVAIDPKRI